MPEQIWFRDKDLAQLGEEEMVPLRRETGMLFQNGALFDSLTVGENVAFPLREHSDADEQHIPVRSGARTEDCRSPQSGAQVGPRN